MQSSTASGLNKSPGREQTDDPLGAFKANERLRREQILQQYTDADFLLAPWLANPVLHENTLRDGFVPKGSDLRDFSILG